MVPDIQTYCFGPATIPLLNGLGGAKEKNMLWHFFVIYVVSIARKGCRFSLDPL